MTVPFLVRLFISNFLQLILFSGMNTIMLLNLIRSITSGSLLFHDIFRGLGDPPFYPTPWAENHSISALTTEKEARFIIEQVGLEIDQWLVKVQESIEFFQRILARIEADGPLP